MAHNYRILDGAWYISKAGHDSNDGLTPETPKQTLVTGMEGIIIFGAGHYTSGSSGNSHRHTGMVADGKVILDGLNIGTNAYYHSSFTDVNGLEYRNMRVTCRQGTIANGIAKDCVVHANVTSSQLQNFISIRSTHTDYGTNVVMNYRDSVIIDSSGLLNGVTNSYTNFGTQFTIVAAVPGIRYSNYRGTFILRGVYFTDGVARTYAIQDQFVGTPQDNGYATNVLWINEANLVNEGYTGTQTDINNLINYISTCINRDPLFNNESIEDFSLQAGSPHIGRGETGGNIGGTKLAVSVVNSNNGMGTLKVLPSPEIDTTNVNTYTLKSGYVEGYIDYIQKIGSSPLTLGVISPISVLNFNTDFDGGSLENNNVPDSEPSTSDYPRRFTTTSDAVDAQTLEVSGHNIQVGEFVRVNGEDREVISTTTSNVRVASVFRSNIIGGTGIQVGSETDLATLKPNRLTYQLRTSKKEDEPVFLSDWDNDTDPLYSMAGKFLTQEWDTVPGYVIDTNTNTLYGAGDSTAPRGLAHNEISCKWVNLRVFIRNNYDN